MQPVFTGSLFAAAFLLLTGSALAQTSDQPAPGAAVPTKEETPACSLAQALVERDSQKLVFRVTVGYGPKGNLVMKIDSPTGVALQNGLEFSPDAVKVYRMPFQTCLPQGCSAVLVIADDLKQDLQKSEKGSITVYALGGQALRALVELGGFADGLTALDKRKPSR